MYGVFELARAWEEWQKVTASQYASPSRPLKSLSFDGQAMGDMHNGRGEVALRGEALG